jgi:hypothetical protein
MPARTIKLGKNHDLASVIKQIKTIKDREVIFQIPEGSELLTNSDDLKMMKKSGEVLGKKIFVQTDDEIGRVLAKKAGVLLGDTDVKMPKSVKVRPKNTGGMGGLSRARFSDIATRKNTAVSKTVVAAETDDVFPKPQIHYHESHTPGSNKLIKTLVLILGGLVLVVIALAVFLPQATVTVTARSEEVVRDLEITVDKLNTQPIADKLLIPGSSVNREVSQTKKFPTTGTKSAGTKTTGTVTLYNQTTNTLRLNAATTTLIANGKKFLLTENLSGIQPGTPMPDVEITAEQAGSDYNLPAETKFQVVNAALGNQNVYAINPVAFKGGTTTTSATILSQEDLDKATEALTSQVLAQAEADLSSENGGTVRLLPSAAVVEVLAKTPNKNVGDTVDNFDMTMVAKVTGVAFKEDDVINVAISKINEVLSSDKYLDVNAKKDYTANFKSVDIPNTRGVLAVHFQTVAAYKVNSTNLSKVLAGKNETEIKELLLSKPEIDNVKVEFWPEFFVNKAPRFNGKIKINPVLNPQ